ncbi:MAG: GIY-YIG nuclease family protein [Parcubacteria group bacterium]|jgi:putative endonuclease
MLKYLVYVIKSEENRYYIGFTADIEIRLSQHNSGLSRWTKQYKNWKVIYTKNFENITDARKWELYLKKQKGGNGFKKEIGIL